MAKGENHPYTKEWNFVENVFIFCGCAVLWKLTRATWFYLTQVSYTCSQVLAINL
jgi:hypothetical protein